MLLCALYVLLLVAAVANGQCVPPRVREANELEFRNKAEKFYFSTFGWLCQRVNRVCLDSGAVIIHDPELQRKHPESVFGGGLPNFGVEDIAEGEGWLACTNCINHLLANTHALHAYSP